MEMMEGDMKSVISYWMEGEIKSFINVWLSAYLSLSYCYFSAKILPKGPARLAAFLPVIALFLLLPLQLGSIHLVCTTAFFLTWLAVFKLHMLASGKGPLSAPSVSLSLPGFIAVASLPIKLQSHDEENRKRPKSILNYAVKAILFASVLKLYDYGDYIHPKIMMVLYGSHLYLGLEMMLAAIAAAVSRAFLGAQLEPHFDEPYLSASLQDFWSRRWNLMVPRILRPTVYLPMRDWSSTVVSRKWAPLPAVMLTFIVSGLVHELLYYYMGRVRPTWEIACLFLLHGTCVTAEIGVKKLVNGRWQLPRTIGMFLTIGFLMVTSSWLGFPQLLRCKAFEREFAERAAVKAFVKDLVQAVTLAVVG